MSQLTPLGGLLLFMQLIGSGKKETSPRSDKPVTFSNSPKRDAPWDKGKNGNCFHDDPFFNPWAPGGSFNKRGRW